MSKVFSNIDSKHSEHTSDWMSEHIFDIYLGSKFRKKSEVESSHIGPVFLVCIVMSDEFTKRLVIKRKTTCA